METTQNLNFGSERSNLWDVFKKVFEWWNYRTLTKLQYSSDCMCSLLLCHLRLMEPSLLQLWLVKFASPKRSRAIEVTWCVVQGKCWQSANYFKSSHDLWIENMRFKLLQYVSIPKLWLQIDFFLSGTMPNISTSSLYRSLGWHKSEHPPTHAHLSANMLQDFFPPLSNKGIPHLLMVIQDTDGQSSLFFQFLPWLLGVPLLRLLVKLKKFRSLVTLSSQLRSHKPWDIGWPRKSAARTTAKCQYMYIITSMCEM